MFPLIPTLALSFFSFIASAFIILRIVIPILPPSPLSRRVPPSEFGLPNFRSLSPADKSHIWLASCDILALAIFVWQAVNEYLGGPAGYAVVNDPASAVRLWFAITLRQSCLLIVASLTLLHVRLGRPVSFGGKHWMLWAPTLILVATSTALAGVLAGTGVPSFFVGLAAYSSTIAVISSVAFACLIGTLVIIRRNLARWNEISDPWPPAKQSEQPRPSFASEDVDAMKDGSSWITSRASSRQDSISAFSFSTHHSVSPSNVSVRSIHPAAASHPSIPAKSSYWFNPATPYNGRTSPVPPVPPLPAPYIPSSHTGLHDDPDPFRREPRSRLGSQSSWLTEHSSEHATLSAWSFPTTRPGTPAAYPSTPDLFTELLPSTAVSRPLTPAMSSADVLGGYGYAPEAAHAEKGASSTAVPTGEVDVSVVRAAGWLITIWVPLALALPYFFMVSPHTPLTSPVAPILLVLSVTLSSPLLALNILFRSPLPIPTGLFDTPNDPPSVVMRAPSPVSSAGTLSYEYKRSGSVTVVEGRRSGDVWVANGDAVEGKSKISRAMGLLQPKPKLAVLPPGGEEPEEPLTPPLPMQTEENMGTVPPTPQSTNVQEFGGRMTRPGSKASSYYSGADESVQFATQIMIAQRHYSTLATTMVLPPSPKYRASMDAAATGVDPASVDASTRRSSHLRARSVSSISGPNAPISPPPSLPLPPTPPSIKSRKAARLTHRKSQSSSGFSFGAIDNTNEIDALSAGVLPLLVPGLRVGSDMKITNNWKVSPSSSVGKSSTHGNRSRGRLPSELGGISSEFSSPEFASTPYERRAQTTRTKKISGHKRHHFSLPSLSLGKDGLHALNTWRNDLNRALDSKLGQYAAVTVSEIDRRNTVWGGEYVPNSGSSSSGLNVVREEDELLRPASPDAQLQVYNGPSLGRSTSMRNIESMPRPPSDIPEGMSTARNSLATLITALDQELRMPMHPPSANSEITLFDFNANGPNGPELDFDVPQAESTPHESRTHTGNRRHSNQSQAQAPPPVPKLPQSKTSRRSSIVYIKSDENAPPPSATTSTTQTTARPTTSSKRLADRVRPLMPKTKSAKLVAKTKPSSPTSDNDAAVNGSPGGGLRPLSLLQNRDLNLARTETRPLTVGKKGKKPAAANEENSPESTSSASSLMKRGFRPFKLARSETTKQRAILRQEETLPDVIVRPPSESLHNGFAYSFRH